MKPPRLREEQKDALLIALALTIVVAIVLVLVFGPRS